MTNAFNQFYESMEKGKQLCMPDDPITEGIADIEDNSKYSSMFDKLLDALNTKDAFNKIRSTDTYLEIRLQDTNIPTVIFNFDPRITDIGYNPEHDIMLISAIADADAYRDADDMKSLLSKYKPIFIHEMNHKRDRSKQYTPDKHFNKPKAEVHEILDDLYGSIQRLISRDVFSEQIKDIDYLNKQTEYNSRTLQYIWECISQFLKSEKVSIGFREFVAPMLNANEYQYFTQEVKKRIIKRMYYVWMQIRQLAPKLNSLDSETVESIHTHILNLTESETHQTNFVTDMHAEMACKIVLNESSAFTKQERKLTLGLISSWDSRNYTMSGWDWHDTRSIEQL